MNIYLLRHGETDWNINDLMQGQVDIPLNENGLLQAQELAKNIDMSFDLIYSSPLSRAIDTAHIVVPHQEILIDKRLIEFGYGPYEGKSIDEVDDAFKNFLFHPLTIKPPKGVETIEELNQRVQSFIEELPSKNILIVSHAVVIRSIISLLTPLNPWAIQIENCHLYQIKDQALLEL